MELFEKIFMSIYMAGVIPLVGIILLLPFISIISLTKFYHDIIIPLWTTTCMVIWFILGLLIFFNYELVLILITNKG